MLNSVRKLSLFILIVLVSGFVLSACGSSPSGSSGPVTVKVTLTDFMISSSLTDFSQNVPYHFEVTNNGSTAHEFEIMPPETGTLTADQIKSLSLAGITSDQLAPGATKTLDYTFTKAYPAGTLEFACHLPGHYEAGMHIPITVK